MSYIRLWPEFSSDFGEVSPSLDKLMECGDPFLFRKFFKSGLSLMLVEFYGGVLHRFGWSCYLRRLFSTPKRFET